jgi:hypothetical protein
MNMDKVEKGSEINHGNQVRIPLEIRKIEYFEVDYFAFPW